MYTDTVTEDKLVHKPRFLLVLGGCVFVLFFILYFTDTIIGEFLRPAIGDPETSGYFGRFATALSLTFLFIINLLALSFMKRMMQIAIVWLELFLLFLSFFYLFDLSLPFIQKKIWFMISQGLFTTLYISAVSIVIASVIAVIGAVAKLSSNGFAYAIASFYTSLFRGLPLLLQVYLIYMGLPQLGYVIDAVPAGIIALSLCYGAYTTEIFRAGIQSIPQGQWEASRALGFNFTLVMKRIILPQAIPIVIPATGNNFISMLKDSSLVSVVGVWELMYLAQTLGQRDFRNLEMLITAAMIYWALTVVLEIIQARIELHYRKQVQR
ncbi:MAG: amino acid ABC transporter permease [Gammaproteobacteria bacterium]|nr:amino acid ABC transporter permease [Gammaproteobacteria bacterium]